ncbi:hypothetical protein [Streptomyces sp. NPDC020362]|uniref:hypothetical protein n=1 Tax=unclassified Streptomyces TaxID=2593676 RepID=UPI0033EC4397
MANQPPSSVGDGGEVEAAGAERELDGQAGDVGEVPDVVLEHRADGCIGKREAGLPADVGGGEDRGPAVEGSSGESGGHAVISSGRRGSSASWPSTWLAASVRTAASDTFDKLRAVILDAQRLGIFTDNPPAGVKPPQYDPARAVIPSLEQLRAIRTPVDDAFMLIVDLMSG